MIDNLLDFLVDLDDFFKIKDVLIVHFFRYFKEMTFPIQYNEIFLIIKHSIGNREGNIKERFEPVFKPILNSPSVITVAINSIQIIVVLAP